MFWKSTDQARSHDYTRQSFLLLSLDDAIWTNDDHFRTFDRLRLLKLSAMSLNPLSILLSTSITAMLAAISWHVVRKICHHLEERARDAECQRIAREIHDTLLQGMQVVLFRLDSWSKDAAIPPLQRSGIGLVTTQLRAIVIETRDKIAGLREMHLQRSDLIERLKEFGKTESECNGIRIEIHGRGSCRTLTQRTHDELLMIAREAIRNALKHAEPRTVSVEVSYESSGLSLDVVDDGRGIDDHIALSGGADGHYGLPGMRERVSQIGGQMTIQTRAPIGTRLRFWVPATSAFSAYASG